MSCELKIASKLKARDSKLKTTGELAVNWNGEAKKKP